MEVIMHCLSSMPSRSARRHDKLEREESEVAGSIEYEG
jgi:hypothetical protein